MIELKVEGIRCFREAQTLPIRPITILVGENSSGKSTVLALVRAAWDTAFGLNEPDFSEKPFDLGGFDAIAHYHGGQGKRVPEFTFGGTFKIRAPHKDGKPSQRSVSCTFGETNGQPSIRMWELKQDMRTISLRFVRDDAMHIAVTSGDTLLIEKTLKFSELHGVPLEPTWANAQRQLQYAIMELGQRPQRSYMDWFDLLPGIAATAGAPARPFASAPIRSKPDRTYDPKRGLPEPEGSHVPVNLAILHATHPKEFEGIVKGMADYGKAGNLFTKFTVKRLGKKAGDPFQLMVAVDKFPFNVRDVGYGVSQILPLLVDTLSAAQQQTFLWQQPEVHLHPRAQAALGTLIVRQAEHRKQKFIIETHSDHLLDRIRMEIRDNASRGGQRLSHADVVILYFERTQGAVKVRPIELDEQGNLVDAPPGYRSFFLDEERRLLGLGGD